MNRRNFLVPAVAMLGLVAGCERDGSNNGLTAPNLRADVHLSGTHVHSYTVPLDFVEHSRQLVHGVRDAKGRCSFTAPPLQDGENAGQVVESNLDNCNVVVVAGTLGALSTTSSAQPFSILSQTDAKYKAGFKLTGTIVFWLQNELQWTWSAGHVSGGSQTVTNGDQSPMTADLPVHVLTTASGNTSYTASASDIAFIVAEDGDPVCTTPGTYYFTVHMNITGSGTGFVSPNASFAGQDQCNGAFMTFWGAV